MKRLITLVAVFTALTVGMNAEILMKESFNYEVGDLTKKDMIDDEPVTTAEWFYTIGTSAKIGVVDTALTKKGYQSTASAKSIRLLGNTNKAVRAFNSVNSGSVYYSVLIHPQKLKNTTSKDYFISLTEGVTTASKNFARINMLNNYAEGTFQVGISKAGEALYRMWGTKLSLDSTYLLVVRYDFVAGEKNDEVSLWVNPTKLSETTPTLVCVQDSNYATNPQDSNYATNPKDNKAAGYVADASYLSWVYIKPSTNLPTDIVLDEIRVATKWAELFEDGGSDEPAISVNNSMNFDIIYKGESDKKTLSITASSLKEDITITHTHSDISLSATKIIKSAAESGASIDVSLAAKAVGVQKDTIVLTSSGLVKKVAVSWTVADVVECATIAALKEAAKDKELYDLSARFTGEAIVTRDTVISDIRELYIEDASGAAKIVDDSNLWPPKMVGKKITNCILLNGGVAFSVQPFSTTVVLPKVVSTGNKLVPQEVTLAELQANAADYLLELVKIRKVSFANAGETFASGQWPITQDGKEANVKVEMSTGITGHEIPALAHVTGFSLNVSGTVIVPRNASDIFDANPELLANGSFEQYTPSGMGTEWEYWEFTLGQNVELIDVLDGKAAVKASITTEGRYLSQQVSIPEEYPAGSQFKLTINYKVLTSKGEDDITMDSYWHSAMVDRMPDDAAILVTTVGNASEWTEKTFEVTKPATANSLYIRIGIKKGVDALFDKFALTYIEPKPTAMEETTAKDVNRNARKFIRQGQMFIERDGVIYNILGGK